ncbi:MAG: sulfite exporter TauE/SafE family protein [Gaiellales bacterium]|nr:MAG: sulfite exporter TauE/SafE family protein [Gaiellales bacterium]
MFIGLTMGKLIALLIVGFVGGLLSGFIGSGGAFVLTPSMMSLGAPGAVAVASNMAHKFPKAMVGTYKRFRYGQVDVRLGLVMAVSSILGVQLGIKVQKMILNTWGSVGSDLYVSFVFVVILVVVGGFVLKDAITGGSGAEGDEKERKLAKAMQKIKIPPMIHFKKADVRLSMWVTVPIGFATGLLAATIAVGGFIGVPGMIYLVGASAIVASATELLVAFVMGFWGSIQWALSGLVDIRLTLLILAASLFGVQLGAIGTTYVKDHTIKLVMAAVMLIVAVSRGVLIPVYLDELGVMAISPGLAGVLDSISFWALITALATAGVIISSAMIKGIIQSRVEEREAAAAAGGV